MGLIRLAAIILFVGAVLVALKIITGISQLGLDSGGLLAWIVSGSYDYALPLRGNNAPPS